MHYGKLAYIYIYIYIYIYLYKGSLRPRFAAIRRKTDQVGHCVSLSSTNTAPPGDDVCKLIAIMAVHLLRALLTLDAAAPEELAVTVFRLLFHHRPIPPAAAHQRTTVQAVARPVAFPSGGAERTDFRLVLAEVRRLFDVHEVPPGGTLLATVDGSETAQSSALVGHFDATCTVEFVLEEVTHLQG